MLRRAFFLVPAAFFAVSCDKDTLEAKFPPVLEGVARIVTRVDRVNGDKHGGVMPTNQVRAEVVYEDGTAWVTIVAITPWDEIDRAVKYMMEWRKELERRLREYQKREVENAA